MAQDNSYSYVHFTCHNQAQYIEDWKDYAIPYNDIDTSRLFEETGSMFPHLLDEDDSIPLTSTMFGAKVHKHKDSLKQQVWSDLNIEGIQCRQPDMTILAPVHSSHHDTSLADFLANGHAETCDADFSQDELCTSELLANHTFNYKVRRTGSYSMPAQAPVQTPRVVKSRQPSSEKFQTPITRIVR